MKSLILGLFVSATALAQSTQPTVGTPYTQTAIDCTTTSAQILAKRPGRKYLLIQNHGGAAVRLKMDSVQAGTEGLEIAAGGNWEAGVAPTNAIFCKSVSGTNNLEIFEGR